MRSYVSELHTWAKGNGLPEDWKERRAGEALVLTKNLDSLAEACNPVSLTVAAGIPLMAARFEEQEGRIVVDRVDQVREYPLQSTST